MTESSVGSGPLRPGDYVTYVPTVGERERGIVKRDDGDFAFVVYHCGGNWERFADYTAARKDKRDLVHDWR